jgi:ribonuclease HI
MTSAAPQNVGGTGQDVLMSSMHDRNDGDRSLNRAARRPVTRTPTAAMRTAPFHLGAVSWANPWEATDEGALFRWVIARHDVLQGNTEFIEGSERGSAPEARVVTNIEAMLGEDPTLTWIGVPASRLALFRQLEASQLQATCGGEHNFGLERAVILMQQRTAEAMRCVNLASWPKLPQAPRRKQQGESSQRLCLSEPRVTRSVLGSQMSLIACDGSLDPATGIGAYAVVSSDGSMYAATGAFTSSGDAELCAIVAGLELGVESGSKSFALITDSLVALDRFERILRGGRNRADSSLRDRIRDVRRLLPSDVTVHHVRRDSGAPLHDAADAIAFAVRRAATLSDESIPGRLEDKVDELMSAVRATAGAEAPCRSMKRVVVSSLP